MSDRSRLSKSERIEIVKWYAIYQNAAEVARQFQGQYNRTHPARNSILGINMKPN
jgi:hypothetical protein